MKKNRVGAPSKPPELKKVPVNLRLPKWLVDLTKDKEECRAVMIEKALCQTYGFKRPEL